MSNTKIGKILNKKDLIYYTDESIFHPTNWIYLFSYMKTIVIPLASHYRKKLANSFNKTNKKRLFSKYKFQVNDSYCAD